MPRKSLLGSLAVTAITLAVSAIFLAAPQADARRHSAAHTTKHSRTTTSSRSSSSSKRGRHGHTRAHGRGHEVAHHGRHHVVAHQAPKTRYAYPIGIFMKSPPAFDSSPLTDDTARDIVHAFERGTADSYPARTLVRAGIVKYHPLHGGIFWRREPIKYIVMHSTETGVPISGVRVIESWSSMGIRHPGAQYVVDRDGTIYQAVDPELATVHVNIFKTLPGINNDNSIGIEMNHTGSQNYPQVQRDAVIKLVGYLKHRYNIDEGNIITHRYAQQGDHTDPVNFDWDGFLATVNSFHNQAIAYRSRTIKDDARQWKREPEAKINTYLKPHREVDGVELSKPESKAEPKPELKPEPKPEPKPDPRLDTPIAPGFEKNASVAPSNGDDVMEVPTPLPAKPKVVPGESPVPEPTEADPVGAAGGAKTNANPAAVQAPLPGLKP